MLKLTAKFVCFFIYWHIMAVSSIQLNLRKFMDELIENDLIWFDSDRYSDRSYWYVSLLTGNLTSFLKKKHFLIKPNTSANHTEWWDSLHKCLLLALLLLLVYLFIWIRCWSTPGIWSSFGNVVLVTTLTVKPAAFSSTICSNASTRPPIRPGNSRLLLLSRSRRKIYYKHHPDKRTSSH